MNTQLPIDLPPSEDDLFGRTTCAECNVTLPRRKAIVGCMFNGAVTLQEHFCSFDCRDEWRLEQQDRAIHEL